MLYFCFYEIDNFEVDVTMRYNEPFKDMSSTGLAALGLAGPQQSFERLMVSHGNTEFKIITYFAFRKVEILMC